MGLFLCLEFKEEGTYKFTLIFPEGAFHFLITLTWLFLYSHVYLTLFKANFQGLY